MSLQEALSEYERALEERREAAMEKMRLDDRVSVCERRLELLAAAGVNATIPVGDTERFMERHRGDLMPSDREFLSQKTRPLKDVREHTGISDTQIRRLAESGAIQAERDGRNVRQYRTLSVIAYLLKKQRRK